MLTIQKTDTPPLLSPELKTPAHSGGLFVLKAPENVLARGHRKGKATFLSLPPRPYEKVIRLIRNFTQNRKGNTYGAWIMEAQSPFFIYPPALAARGLELSHILFIETHNMAQTLQGICEANIFTFFVAEGRLAQAHLQIARRWIKPPERPLWEKAEALAARPTQKLSIFI